MAEGRKVKCANPKCGKEFEQRTPLQKYCSDKCRSERYCRAKGTKPLSEQVWTCVKCGAKYTPKNGRAKYCDKCRGKRLVESQRKYEAEHKEERQLKMKIYYITGEWPRGKLK